MTADVSQGSAVAAISPILAACTISGLHNITYRTLHLATDRVEIHSPCGKPVDESDGELHRVTCDAILRAVPAMRRMGVEFSGWTASGPVVVEETGEDPADH